MCERKPGWRHRKFNEQDDPGNGCVRRRTRHVQKRSRKPLAGRRPISKPPPPPESIDRSCSTFISSLTRTGTASGTCPPSAFASASSRWSTSCSTPRPASGESFLLDGQAIVLDDYARVRPERVQALGESLRAGRLEAGPWYVLADELIPSGEALVRNLLTGRRTLERFGAVAPPVLYCPDSFGHPASLPAIAAGFGLRGRRALARLRQPAISARRHGLVALADRRTRAALSPRAERVRARVAIFPSIRSRPSVAGRRCASELAPRSTTGVVLLPHGADHHARQLGHAEALRALEAAASSDTVHRSSLRAFQRALVARAERAALPLVEGELRDSYGYTWTLSRHVRDARARETAQRARRARAAARRRTVERARVAARPVAPRAARRGVANAARGAPARHALRLLDRRGRGGDGAARSIRHESGGRRPRRCDLRSHRPRSGGGANVARCVAAGRAHSQSGAAPRGPGVAILEIEEFVADVPVGPGSAPTAAPARRGAATNADGRGARRLSRCSIAEMRNSRTESPRHYPDNDLVVGHARRRVGRRRTGLRRDRASDRPRVRAARRRRIVCGPRRDRSRTSTLAVTVHDDATVSLLHKPSGRRVESLVRFEDDADVGDLYTPAPRPRPMRRSRRPACAACTAGRFAASSRWPRGSRNRTLRAVKVRRRRHHSPDSRRGCVIPRGRADAATTSATITACGSFSRATSRIRKCGRTRHSGPCTAHRSLPAPTRRRANARRATAPLHRYVSLFDGSRGCTVLSDGLAEYESRDDGSVAVTLVRSVGELSKSDLPERPGHAGWPVPTPQAQCRGPFAANLAVTASRRARRAVRSTPSNARPTISSCRSSARPSARRSASPTTSSARSSSAPDSRSPRSRRARTVAGSCFAV